MIASKAVRLEMGTLLAADATTLAPALSANKVVLIKTAFTPSENLVPGNYTEADFDGYAAKAGVTGTQESAIDPLTNQQVLTMTEPAAGWRFQSTGITNLPQTIYGFALVDSTKATVLGSQLLPTPVPITNSGQEINLGTVKFTVNLQPLS